MKNLTLILFTILTLTIIGACSNAPEDKLHGKWISENNETIQFLEDGNVIMDNKVHAKYSYENDVLHILGSMGQTFSWKVDITSNEIKVLGVNGKKAGKAEIFTRVN